MQLRTPLYVYSKDSDVTASLCLFITSWRCPQKYDWVHRYIACELRVFFYIEAGLDGVLVE